MASPGRRTVAAYLDEWLIGVRPTLAVAAWTNYRSLIDLYVRPRIGQLQLVAVTGSTLTKLYAELPAGGGKHGKPLSPTTVRLVHRVLSKALEDAVEARLLAANPARRAKVPKRRRVEMHTWKAEEATAFLAAAADDPLYACWLLALVCGLRRGELAGLRWSDVDLGHATLSVVEQRTTDADWQIVTKEPKGTSRRTIDLGPQAVTALRLHRKQTLAEQLDWGTAWTDSGLVFVRADGLGRRGAGDQAPRRPSLLRHPRSVGRHPPQGGPAAARACLVVDHDGPLYPQGRASPEGRLGADRVGVVVRGGGREGRRECAE